MSSPAGRINALVERFVAGQPLRDFHRDLVAFSEAFDERVLPAAQRDAYWALCDLVYLGRSEPVAPEGVAEGTLGEAALRERLRRFHLRESDSGGADA